MMVKRKKYFFHSVKRQIFSDASGQTSAPILTVCHIYVMTYWPAAGGRGQNTENTAQGHSGHNSICP